MSRWAECPRCGTDLDFDNLPAAHETPEGETCSFQPGEEDWVEWMEEQIYCVYCGEGSEAGDLENIGDGLSAHPACVDEDEHAEASDEDDEGKNVEDE
jgi:hypothetical protein